MRFVSSPSGFPSYRCPSSPRSWWPWLPHWPRLCPSPPNPPTSPSVPPSPPKRKKPCKSTTYKDSCFEGGSKTGSNMLGLPIYLIGSTYYLHTRIEGRQVRRSLRTSYQRVAIIRAINLMDSLMRKDLPQSTRLTSRAASSKPMALRTMPGSYKPWRP